MTYTAALALAFFASVAKAGVWDAVGQVDSDGTLCTGTLIASDIVLTAAHCLYDADGTPISAEQVTFRAGYSGGVSVADVSVASWLPAPGYRDEGEIQPGAEAIRSDVALLLLAEPMTRDTVVPIALHPGLLRTNEVRTVSYSKGIDAGLSPPMPCRLLHRFADGVMEFDCTMHPGASGAPVLAERGGRLSILSVISAVATDENGLARSYGASLPAHVATLRSRLTRAQVSENDDKGARRIGVGERGSAGARFVRP